MSSSIAVVGGGAAGLACACELAEHGASVVLIEASNALGGRLGSFRDPETGLMLDNCQHVILGCCKESIGFLRRIGSLDQVEFHEKINVTSGGRGLSIQASRLPAPFHLLPSIAGSSYLSRSDKLGLGLTVAGMFVNRPGKGESARQHLRSLGCSNELMDHLMDPVIVAALNEPAEQASASYARMVLIETLVKGRQSYRLGVPCTPHSEIIARAASRWLNDNGCEIRLGARVRALRERDGLVRGVELASGEVIACEACVAAVTPGSLEKMGISAQGGTQLRWLPIVSAHLFFESPTPAFEPICVVDQPFGWVFSKRPDVGYVQVVASAAQGLIGLAKTDLLDLALRAARTAEPLLGGVPLRRGTVYPASRATFATLACDAHRPTAGAPKGNLYLAGDWTATGWPATIESAIRSGRAAAKALIEPGCGSINGVPRG